MAQTANIYFSSSGGWEVQDQGASRSGIWWEPISWFTDGPSSPVAEGTRELSGVSFKRALIQTAPVVQWLRIHLPMQGTQVRSLVWEDPTCRRATKPVCCNYWARVPQLLKAACSRARVPQLLSPHAATTEAHAPRARAPQQEKPLQCEARTPQQRVVPTRHNWRKPVQQGRPNAAKNKNK